MTNEGHKEENRPTKRQRNSDAASTEVNETKSPENNSTSPNEIKTIETNDNKSTTSKQPVYQSLVVSLYPHLTTVTIQSLTETAEKLTSYGKGITACDESSTTIGKRFHDIAAIPNTVENRRKYRQMLFETEGIEEFLSGAILDVETLYQKSSNTDELFPKVLLNRGIVPGVKPHLKVYALPGMYGDTVMQGLDSLSVRAREYYSAGARFAKWRSPLTIDTAKGRPTDVAIKANMSDLGRYALICQSEGLVPIVEPDVSLSGTHTLEQAVKINVKVHSELYKSMVEHGVFMGGSIVKTNFVNPGIDCPTNYTVAEIAEANVFFLEQVMPKAIKGVNYLSGGQTLRQSLARLDAINRAAKKRNLPWNLSFSWSQALQLPLLELCKSTAELEINTMAAQYVTELKLASQAAKGELEYTEGDGDHNPKHADSSD